MQPRKLAGFDHPFWSHTSIQVLLLTQFTSFHFLFIPMGQGYLTSLPTVCHPQNQVVPKPIPAKLDKTFIELPESLPTLLPKLLVANLLARVPLKLITNALLSNHNSNTQCSYHMGAPGHSLDCRTLKNKIHDLIEPGDILIDPLNT